MTLASAAAFEGLVRLDRPERHAAWALLAAGAALRLWIIPSRLVMIFMGYRLAAEVYAFTSVPKYGAATFVLYRAAFAWLGPSHDTIIAVNVACGVLALPLLVGLVARWRPPPGVAGVVAGLLALSPIFLRDHRSESILVPMALWTWASLLLWDRWWERRSRLDLAGSVVLAALAITSRPEMAAVMPALLAVFALPRGADSAAWRARLPALAPAALALAALVSPHLWHLARAVGQQHEQGALPGSDGGLLTVVAKALRVVFDRNVLWTPSVLPAAVTALLVAGWRWTPAPWRAWARALLVLCVGWMVSFFVDLPPASVPRLGAPLAALACLVAAFGAVAAWQRGEQVRWLPRRGGPRAAVLVGACALTALPTAIALWAPTNEGEEEAFVRDAFALLPADAVCLLRPDATDPPPPRKAHRYVPDYLLRPPHRNDRVLGLTAWRQAPPKEDKVCPGGTFVLLSMHCYVEYLDLASQAKSERREPAEIASCRDFRAAFTLVPVLERTVPHHGDNDFGYYPEDVSSFRLGLYRVGGKR